ncbi:LamG domain-containing protein [Seonamhaeicola sp.]|uniref:LamG domain-containing protein n=1 Tax=Seonamhaeicola sp. TaxID=1912245 RepID=UPI0026052D9A|nr:LamG domain-containing protein [Seonamhaeicola sp.]
MHKSSKIIGFALFLVTVHLTAQNQLVFHMDFETMAATDNKIGYIMEAEGVHGKSVSLDGLTSYMELPSKTVKFPDNNFTIEAWLALQEYPWNWTGAFDNLENNKGVFFGVGAYGELGLFLGNGKSVVKAVADSITRLPHLKWNHIVATFEAKKGITLYVNGQKAGFTVYEGDILFNKNNSVWIGRGKTDTSPRDTERENSIKNKSKMIFDGLLDELKIYDKAFSQSEILDTYKRVKLANEQPLEWRRMPKGPEEMPNRFAAYHTRLNYDEKWERLWRVADDPDILVTFKDSPVRMIFWRGINYGPTWITENGIFTSNQSLEYFLEESGCNEHMSDKQCRYSHVRILEKNDARVVIHWRYALVSVLYDFPDYDKTTNWGDWADEYITIYPDQVAVRKQILHSHRFKQAFNDQTVALEGTYQFNESFVFSQPGESAYQNIDSVGVTMANLKGDIRSFKLHPLPEDEDKWEEENWVKEATIKKINSKSKNKSFNIFEKGSIAEPWVDQAFYTWNHWPVAQLPSDGRFTFVDDRPAHTALSNGSPIWKTEGIKHTAVSLYGMGQQSMEALIDLSKSWNESCTVKVSSEQVEFVKYDKYQRAHIFVNHADDIQDFSIRFNANSQQPFANGAFIIKNVGSSNFSISSDNPEVRIHKAIENKMSGDNLVVFVNHMSKKPFSIKISTNN